MDDLRIDDARLHRRLAALARLGDTGDGGVRRLAFSDEDRAGRDFIEAHLRRLGCRVLIDPLGNLAGLRAGREDGPVVMTGSHTDTVATGGRFDGALGVVAALEALATLDDAGITTRRPLALIVFANEEGARFRPALMGSQYLHGTLALADLRAAEDAHGTRLGDELDRLRFGGPDDLGRLPVHAFVELHIEQGPVLESADAAVGIVTGVPGIIWDEYCFVGETNHAGGTPMDYRHDAGFVAATSAAYVRRLGLAEGAPMRATAGGLTVAPGLPNVIPGEATLTVDLRHPDAARLAAAAARLDAFAREAAAAEGVTITRHRLAEAAPVAFDARVVEAIAGAAKRLGLPSRRLLSGGGHDAQIMAHRCPTGMLFVPSRDGLSHTPAEYTTPAHAEAGANALLHTLLALAEN